MGDEDTTEEQAWHAAIDAGLDLLARHGLGAAVVGKRGGSAEPGRHPYERHPGLCWVDHDGVVPADEVLATFSWRRGTPSWRPSRLDVHFTEDFHPHHVLRFALVVDEGGEPVGWMVQLDEHRAGGLRSCVEAIHGRLVPEPAPASTLPPRPEQRPSSARPAPASSGWWTPRPDRSWRDCFRRSAVGPNVFAVRKDRAIEAEVRSAAYSLSCSVAGFQNHLFGYLCSDAAFAGGVVVHRDHPYIALGEYLDGTWVVGTLALRLLVHELGLRQPTRLHEERRRPADVFQLQSLLAAERWPTRHDDAVLSSVAWIRCSSQLAELGRRLLELPDPLDPAWPADPNAVHAHLRSIVEDVDSDW